jgi:hypothetical protein
VGNAVDGGSVETKFKWGITVHGSHYGSIKDNVVYNYNGAAIATEDGSESFNEFDHNFVMRGIGEPNDSVVRGAHGDGHRGRRLLVPRAEQLRPQQRRRQLSEPDDRSGLRVRLPVAVSATSSVPTFKGAIRSDARTVRARRQRQRPAAARVRKQRSVRRDAGRLDLLVGRLAGSEPGTPARGSVIRISRPGTPTTRPSTSTRPEGHFDGLKIRGKFDAASHCCGDGVWFEDYSTKDIVIRNADIQGMEDGIQAPSAGFGPEPNLLIENSYLRNWRNINVPTPSSVNGCWMEDKLVTISNTRFRRAARAGRCPRSTWSGRRTASSARNRIVRG